MTDWIGQGLILMIGGLLGSGGLIGVWLQSRASRSVGVKAATVEADKASGQLALDLAAHLSTRMEAQDKRIDVLEEENEKRRVEAATARGELRAVLEELESLAVDLRRLVLWDDGGRIGDPPVELADLHERLAALSSRKVIP